MMTWLAVVGGLLCIFVALALLALSRRVAAKATDKEV